MKLSADEFLALRDDVLAAWPTGAAVRLDDAFDYQRAIPPAKRFAEAMRAAR